MQRWPAASLLAVLLACAGDSDPIVPGPPPPVPPASLDGTWSFRITVVTAEIPCDYWLGRLYTPTIKISQAGTTVIAEGFMDLPQNELAGTVNTARRLLLSGHYPEEGFRTTIHQQLNWDGGNTLAGTGTWEWSGLNGMCKRGNLAITATREP